MEETTINPASDSSSQAQSSELVSTVEFSPAPDADQSHGEATNPEAPKDTTKSENNGKEGNEPKTKGDDFRFDKHPRFQELNKSVKEFREQNQRLQEELEKIKASQQQPPTPKEMPFKDWSQMSDDELLDWQASDPKGFLNNLNQAVEYAVQQGIETYQQRQQQVTEKQRFESSVAKTFESYAKENPDFDTMWDSGEIQEYMQKNPGHNAISAHMAMTGEVRIEQIRKEAAEKALKEYEAAQRSKRASKVIGSAPATVPTSSNHADDRLKNPNKYGGDTNVLVARLMERRRQEM